MTTVFITGASAGLGRAVAALFAQSGYATGLIARNDLALAKTVKTLGQRAAWAAADVANYDQLNDAAEQLTRTLGLPDIWVNAAMATVFSRFDDISAAEFARVAQVTFLGSVHGLQIALRSMKARNQGHIIQIGSALAYRAIPLQAPYCSAKHAIRGAVDSLRCELIHDRSRIHVTMIQMPAMNTPQFDWARRHIAQRPQPVPPIYAPESCARAVLWSARHPTRREIWVGKPTFEAIVANRLFPALMDYYMAKRAFEGQFEGPAQTANTEGNLFEPVGAFHAIEGHFGNRQKVRIHWLAISWKTEVISIGVLVLVILAIIAAIIAWTS